MEDGGPWGVWGLQMGGEWVSMEGEWGPGVHGMNGGDVLGVHGG